MKGLGRPAVALAIVTSLAMVAGASGEHSGGPPGGSGPAHPHGGEGPPIATPAAPKGAADDPAMHRANAAARGRQQEERRRRAEPKVKDERRASRARHTGLGSAEARKLAKDHFPEMLVAPAFQPVHLRDGEKIREYLGDHAARIDRGEGRPDGYVESLMPLVTRDDSGDKVPVDLTLRETADGDRAPRRPFVRTEIGDRLHEGVSLPGIGVTVTPQGTGDAAGVETDDKLFYANAAKDTDYLALPRPGGVELAAQLRSAASPESLTWRFDLPEGVTLRRSTGKIAGVDIVEDGATIGMVSAPRAWDADDVPVDATFTVDGNTFTIGVAHRAADVRYPVMVDPSITEDFRSWYTGSVTDYYGWQWQNTSGRFEYYYGPSGYLGGGVYDYSRGTKYFDGGNFANWYFNAPGDSRITRAEFGYVVHEPQTWGTWPYPYNDDYVYEGVWSYRYGRYENGQACEPPGYGGCFSSPFTTYGKLHYNYKSHLGLEATPGNAMIFGAGVYYSGNHQDFTGYMGSAAIVIDDSAAPSITEDNGLSSTAWSSSRSFQARGTDSGLGMRRLTVDSPGNPAWSGNYTYDSGCTGTRFWRCGSYIWVNSSSGNLPEGVQPVRYTATDPVGNQSSRTWDLRLDRSAPTIDTPSGSMWDRRNQASEHRFEGLYDKNYTVSVTARDGSTASRAAERSGVRTVGFELLNSGGAIVQSSADPSPQSCSTSCSKSRSWTIDTDTVADGDYTVRIRATDQLGYSSTSSFPVTVDRRGDVYHSWQRDADPAQGGQVIREEWGRIGTQIARADTDHFLATRTTVPCRDDEPNGEKCDETRLVTKSSSSGDSPQNYEITRGSSTTDPELDIVAEILNGRTSGSPAGSGAIASVASPWQTLPPAHGATYEHYTTTYQDDDGQDRPIQVWVDGVTKMPIRSYTTTESSSYWTYFTYARHRTLPTDHPADFFAAGRPANEDRETDSTHYGEDDPGPQTETEGQRSFTAYWAGGTAIAGNLGSFCLASLDRVENSRNPASFGDMEITEPDAAVQAETPETVEPAKLTFTDARYAAVTNPATCAPGKAGVDTPALEIVSFATESTFGKQWTLAYGDAAATAMANPLDPDFTRAGITTILFRGAPATAYVVYHDDRQTSALITAGDTTIIVTGPFDKTTLQQVADKVVPR